MSAGLFTTRDAGRGERGHLLGGRALSSGDDGAGVAHPAPGRRGLTGDERHDRLLEIRLDPRRRLFLGAAADLADHDHRFGIGVGREQLQRVDVGRADQRIARRCRCRWSDRGRAWSAGESLRR